MQVIVDRIEGNNVVVELPDMTTVAVPLSLFLGAKEGDIFHILKDERETAKRKQRLQDRFNKLKEG